VHNSELRSVAVVFFAVSAPLLFEAIARGDPLYDLEYEIWSQNPESHPYNGLSDGENRTILRLLVLTHYQRVTDGRTLNSA